METWHCTFSANILTYYLQWRIKKRDSVCGTVPIFRVMKGHVTKCNNVVPWCVVDGQQRSSIVTQSVVRFGLNMRFVDKIEKKH